MRKIILMEEFKEKDCLFLRKNQLVQLIQEDDCISDNTGNSLVEVRSTGNLSGFSIYLNSVYEWEKTKDNTGLLCLVPYKP